METGCGGRATQRIASRSERSKRKATRCCTIHVKAEQCEPARRESRSNTYANTIQSDGAQYNEMQFKTMQGAERTRGARGTQRSRGQGTLRRSQERLKGGQERHKGHPKKIPRAPRDGPQGRAKRCHKSTSKTQGGHKTEHKRAPRGGSIEGSKMAPNGPQESPRKCPQQSRRGSERAPSEVPRGPQEVP